MKKRDSYTLKEIWLALNEWRWPWSKLPVATEEEREAIRIAWRSMPKRAEP